MIVSNCQARAKFAFVDSAALEIRTRCCSSVSSLIAAAHSRRRRQQQREATSHCVDRRRRRCRCRSATLAKAASRRRSASSPPSSLRTSLCERRRLASGARAAFDATAQCSQFAAARTRCHCRHLRRRNCAFRQRRLLRAIFAYKAACL